MLSRTLSDLSLTPTSDLPGASVPAPAASHWKKATLAAVLSFLLNGMGQLYNRQPRKAFVLAVINVVSGLFLAHTRILLSFWTMITFVFVGLLWKVWVIRDAAWVAALNKKPESPVPVPRLTYSVIAAIIVAGALVPSPEYIKKASGFGAFKIPSASMCPTVCLGDRLIADMHAYNTQFPKRGDIVLIKVDLSEALFTKRVIGIPGDLVAPGPKGAVLVNGQPFHPPAPCGVPKWEKSEGNELPDFQPITVPKGTFFVVGDNLENSFDSRVPPFPRVTADIIRGRPLFFYWSPTASRIGCSIH